MNHFLTELEQLYQDAIDKITVAAANRKVGEGIFGMGRQMSDEACHMELLKGIESVMEEVAREGSSQEAAQAVRFILERPEYYKKLHKSMYWTMVAAHAYVLPVAPLLTAEDAKELLAWYEKENPKRTRLPVQDNVVKTLKKTC